ncbi:hypothetical protein ES707_12660 [subsurface metagenome]
MTLSTLEERSPICQAPTGQKCPEDENEPVSSESSPSPPPSSQSMAHHNALSPVVDKIYFKKGIEKEKRYGVPSSYRILTMGNYHKHHDDINAMLRVVCELENRERSAVFCLLRLFFYYGQVYPKADDVADQEYISKRTFWRAISKLKASGVIEVLNRYINHKQISNLYRIDKLVLMIARFIAEHHPTIFGDFGDKLTSFFRSFWDEIWDADINLSLPAPVKLPAAGGGS